MSGQIYELIPRVMADVPEIRKLRQHSQQGWTYRGFEDFLTAFRPALLAHGLFLVPEVLDTETGSIAVGNNKEMRHILVKVAYSVYAPDGAMIRSVVIGESWDAQDNASTKAMDDAFTTFLTQVFCVPTGESPAGRTSADRQPGETKSANRPQSQGKNNQSNSARKPASDGVAELKPNDSVNLDTRARSLVDDGRVAKQGDGYVVKVNDRVGYQVTKATSGKVICNCERFETLTDPKGCEHLRAVRLFSSLPANRQAA